MRISDWSSDVCSSDLRPRRDNVSGIAHLRKRPVADEGGCLHAPYPCGIELLDHRDLGERRDHGTNGLESIAWCDLDDFQLLSRVGHMMPSRSKASISLLSRARSSVKIGRAHV